MVASGGMSSRGTLSDVQVSDGRPYWRHLRTEQAGRYTILTVTPDGTRLELLPENHSARTRVHEYGGGAFCVHHGVLFYANDDDQRLYRLDPDAEPVPLTPEPDEPKGFRYADMRVHPDGSWIVAVREDHHQGGEPANELVCLPSDGDKAPRVIAAGHDFYASPRFDPSGDRLCWLSWDHPRMPWEGTELWAARFRPDGSLGEPKMIAGGPEESIFQPEWGPGGRLHFVSDQSDWWNLYRWDGDEIESLYPMQAEFGSPAWAFGLSRYAFLSDGQIGCVYTQEGVDHLGVLDVNQGRLSSFDVPFTAYYPAHLRSDGEKKLWFLASGPRDTQALVELDVDSGDYRTLHKPQPVDIDEGYLSEPRTISFPTDGGKRAHAIFYPPTNMDFEAPEGDLPPLVIKIHGGPTSAAAVQLHLEIQYFTSRGYAVADVNYGGSTGYGRPYRERLHGEWGVVDVRDCVHAARYLAEQGIVDGDQLLIRGGSAGGFVTLAALAFHEAFAAGASYYGVADAEALAVHTHKFESRYLDTLVGPYPEKKDLYQERSPIHHTEALDRPLILFQGDEDAIVPPEQSREMYRAVREKGIPCAYLEFEGEQHGFRRTDTIVRCLEAELYFYSRVLDIPLKETIEPVEIDNLD